MWRQFVEHVALRSVYAEFESRDTLAADLSERLLQPFFQQQATLNRHAAYLDELADILDAPLEGYANVADLGTELATRTADEAFASPSLYNLVGSFMLSSQADYAPYARRVADLEGIRRAALATVMLRDAETATAELAASPLRNPYDDQPLRWDAEDRAIVFLGLEPGERGEHRFYY